MPKSDLDPVHEEVVSHEQVENAWETEYTSHNNILVDASLYPTTWVVASDGDHPVCEVGFTVVNGGILVEVTGRDEENTQVIVLNESLGGKIVIKAGELQ